MRCPKCGHLEDKVIDSRTARDGQTIRRRRVCVRCGYRFTTYETIVRATLRVIKRDGRREPFDRQKLLNGVRRACEKRPVSTADMEALADAVLDELEAEYEGEVPTHVIGEKVMARLERLDEVAYVRFASVYRRFKDINQFMSAIQGMMRKE